MPPRRSPVTQLAKPASGTAWVVRASGHSARHERGVIDGSNGHAVDDMGRAILVAVSIPAWGMQECVVPSSQAPLQRARVSGQSPANGAWLPPPWRGPWHSTWPLQGLPCGVFLHPTRIGLTSKASHAGAYFQVLACGGLRKPTHAVAAADEAGSRAARAA
jgi:hypothetical protein